MFGGAKPEQDLGNAALPAAPRALSPEALIEGLWLALGKSSPDSRRDFIVRHGLEGHDVRGLNQPYPSEVLAQKGYIHSLPIEVATKFKWLEWEPVFMDEARTLLLLPAQVEGGEDTFGGGEVTCRDRLILLQRDEQRGVFVETASLLTYPIGSQMIFNSESFEKVDESTVRMTFRYSGQRWTDGGQQGITRTYRIAPHRISHASIGLMREELEAAQGPRTS